MAPGTNIGSATPISSGGEDLDAKVRNDFAASIAALAEQNGHDPDPYRAMVTESLNLTANEALAQDVADTVQPTIEDFVAWLDGRTLDGGGGRDRGRSDRGGRAALVPAGAAGGDRSATSSSCC